MNDQQHGQQPPEQNPPPGRLLQQRHGRVLVLTIDNPAQRNALGPAIYEAGCAALAEAAQDAEIASVVICGHGDTFCAGGSLDRLHANRQAPPEVQRRSTEALAAWITAIRACPRPVLAAVEGAAAGAGVALALACDLVVAAHDAVFVTAYLQAGLTPDGGTSGFLARALAPQAAAEMLYGGGKQTAEQLRAWGVVNRLSAPGQALAEATAWAEQLATQPPQALAATKALLNQAYETPLVTQMAAETARFVEAVHGAEAGQAIAAFLARRRRPSKDSPKDSS